MKIGIDIDDVIADSYPEYLEAFNKQFNKNIQVTEVFDFYHFGYHAGVEKAKVDIFIDTQLHTDEFQIAIDPILDAAKYIQSWSGKGIMIVYVTARPLMIKSITIKWLKKYGFWSAGTKLYLFDEKRLNTDIEYKTSIASKKFVDIFIEDKKDIAEAMRIPVFLIDRPWNKGDISSHITRVYSWKGIDSKLRSLYRKEFR